MNALISRENSRGIILHRVLRENIFRFKKSRQNIDNTLDKLKDEIKD